MKRIFGLLLCMVLLSATDDEELPDLKSKSDLKSLGTGSIVEIDNTIISRIELFEVHEYWIVYLKNESLHEIRMDGIKLIEFKKSKWGFIEIRFPDNKPLITVRED